MRFNLKNKDDILIAIKEHDVISFDIFDTLIMRRTLSPEDVFEILEYKLQSQLPGLDFVKNRRKAILENNIPNPNIYQIYNKFAELTGLDSEKVSQILKLELDIEKRVLIRRESMVDILERAKCMGKAVYLITDMYLPTEIVVEILA